MRPNPLVKFDPAKSIYLDFEFNHTTSSPLNLVSCATMVEGKKPISFWLHKDPKEYQRLAKYLSQFDTLVGYAAVAEARSCLALKLDVLDFNWVDLFIEYKMLSNNNDKLNYGKQLVDGKVKMTVKPLPKWERVENDDDEEAESTGFKPTYSLAEATYKLLEVIRDTKEKDEVRDLIISAPAIFSADEMKRILAYGGEDIKWLPKLRLAMRKEFDDRIPLNLSELKDLYDSESYIRGRFSAHTAVMEETGYPINYNDTLNFSRQVPNIMYDTQREINRLFPEVKPFNWNKNEGRFSMSQQKVFDWIIEYIQANKKIQIDWPLTDSKKLSLKSSAWEKFFPYKHDYPKDKFGAQMVRYLKLKKELFGFSTSKNSKRRKFWDGVGPDKRVRPYFNHYGAQSSRSQPPSSTFLFLKPAWMRALCEPPPGYACGGIDWRSQEFFLSALSSNCKPMIEAYLSGDPYLAFGKVAQMIPKDGTKESHPMERNACKSTVLGISYLMTCIGLAIKLTEDTGRAWDEDEAQEMIDLFYDAFTELGEFQEQIVDDYESNGFLKLPCGWYMWGDNPNFRSVTNVPIQGLGASILRLAVDMARSKGLKVIFTLHDAIYIEFKIGQEIELAILGECMKEATAFYFDDPWTKEQALKIGLDPFAWSPEYPAPVLVRNKKGKMVEEVPEIKVGDLEIPLMQKYVDERSQKEYQEFSKYFEDREEFYL